MTQNILHDPHYQASCAQTLTRLAEADMVDKKDRNFVDSLLRQYKKKGSLSEKQWPWVEKMMVKALGIGDPIQPDPEAELSPELLYKLFDDTTLKSPAVLLGLKTPEGLKEIVVKPKYGVIKVYWQNQYPGFLCTIKKEGNLVFSKYMQDQGVKDAVVGLLKRVCSNPKAVIAEHGKMLSKCCFCKKTLSDPPSLAAGYGPTCAKTWGLPWGTT